MLPYKKHDPHFECNVQKSWVDSLGPSKQQVDINLKTTIADTRAQCFLLGSNHLPGLGLGIDNLIPSEIYLNCANAMTAGNLGVFFAKVRGEHYMTGEVVESRSMVYVMEGNNVLVSRAVLETLGCIPKIFPRVGEFLEDGDLALTGKAFSVNPNPLGLWGDGTPVNKREETDAVKDTQAGRTPACTVPKAQLSDQQPKTIATPQIPS